MSARTALPSLRSLLFHPDEFFRESSFSVAAAFAAVLATSLVSAAAVAAVGWLLAANIDATITVTTMEPWSEATCEGFAEMNATPEQCAIDEPRTKQVDVGSKMWSVFLGRLPLVVVGTIAGWLLVAGGLHLASAVVGGEGSFARTLAVAGWATVPSLVQTGFAVVGVYLVLRGVDFASDPQVLEDQLRSVVAAFRGPVFVLGALVATAWQAYLWTFGLKHARDLDVGAAGLAAGLVAVVTVVLSIV